ncbi:hypothetical protein IscW_ISCW003905 [Ixodes scapularis]|uniref:Uncharacterized protein n=1 Tax=Ixodes scapularis TaxID=6945 RepID=B7PGX9_IXOSC|nr:hypothetical protein IscW_ISCW003905 [Ixodes scapularis]|eukprot:XP_002401587.1 hypothetical protein IscW_ISCW003905 [Ixodes scapularis]
MDNRMDATFRENAQEVRFAVENEISVLNMDDGGRRKFKQFTGGDRVANRQPYDKCNSDFHITAKFVTASNDLPYISKTMQAEQSRLMITPTVSSSIPDQAVLRNTLLGVMAADRYSRKLLGKPYSSYDEYNTFFPEWYPNILDPSFPNDVCDTARSIPSQRLLLSNPILTTDEAKEKLGAALCRILLEKIVPSMSGLSNTRDTVRKLYSYVRSNFRLFDGYKDVVLVVLKRLIVYRKGRRIQVDILRSAVTQQLYDTKNLLHGVLFGKHRDAGVEAFIPAENACKTLDGFKNVLRRLHFAIIEIGSDAVLCDFEWIQ